ncbi:hypothetical protein [Halomonas sp. ISL-104]|uniref:hypothetical protein n=2 Tax=Halomonas TaxID=2745 RepID=UPI0007D95CA6|nr:hypothetical protein [Halomonas sp. ISL-104]OAL59256.1 hypothetical protein A6R74_03320 [Halomonas sp. ALS9]
MTAICNYVSIARYGWGALLLFCVALLTLDTAHSQSEVGECYYLQRDRLLEPLENEPKPAKGVNAMHFFVESPEPSAELPSTRLDDLEIQLRAADALYSEVLGLTPPLHMPRYQRAGFIMVILRADQTRGGQAYDEVVRSAASPGCHIRMALGGQVDAAQNLTPAHELFHLYQNAHMMFKQGWVHEGLARWSESLLRGNLQEGPPLPASVEALERLLQESYGAAPFWQRLFYLLDAQAIKSIPDALRDKRYHDGSQVVATEFYGSTFLPLLFASLDEAGAALSQQEQWPEYGWAEAEQRSLRHNEVILSAVHHAVSTYMPIANQPDELRVFMQLIEPMAER